MQVCLAYQMAVGSIRGTVAAIASTIKVGTIAFETGAIPLERCANALEIGTIVFERWAIALQRAIT